ncbi:MAG TPA: trehalose-phosphatase [Egibacteraceae bacterium]|nr:trehalose-phosphatase [Egibacteraceae bacterium]
MVADAVVVPDLVVGVLGWLAIINFVLALFNLVPAAPLDGGRILRAFLWHRRGDRIGSAITAARAGRTFGFVLVGLGLLEFVAGAGLGGLWLVLIGWFLVNAAGAEEQHAKVRGALGDVRVSQVMSRDPVFVPGSLTVQKLLDRYLFRYHFSAFPVVDEIGRPRGLVTLNRIKQVPWEERMTTTVANIACAPEEIPTAHPDDPVADLLPRLAGGPTASRSWSMRDASSASSRPPTSPACSRSPSFGHLTTRPACDVMAGSGILRATVTPRLSRSRPHVAEGAHMVTIRDLPSAVERSEELAARLAGKTAAVFLDYDGTLTPIVEDAREATLAEATREAIRNLAAVAPVAIVSGRDLADVREMVAVEGIAYAGSHGFDILGPDGDRHERAADALPALDRAHHRLDEALADIPGASVERKKFAVAVHFRRADPEQLGRIEQAVDEVAAAVSGLRKTGGKKIFELRPDVEWHKGKALLWLLVTLDLDRPDVVPVYVGDDVTDEDAFAAIAERGIGIIVRGEDDHRETAAHYSLRDPDEVRSLLMESAAAIKAPDGSPRHR